MGRIWTKVVHVAGEEDMVGDTLTQHLQVDEREEPIDTEAEPLKYDERVSATQVTTVDIEEEGDLSRSPKAVRKHQ